MSLSFIVAAQPSSQGDTLGAFNAGVITPTPDRALLGVEFAEGHFWITGSDPDDIWQHKLYKVSADGQTLVDYYEYGIEFASWKDLAFDGEFLYVSDIDTIRQISTTDGMPTGVKFKGPEYYLSGLAYDPATDHFWVTGESNIIYQVNRQGEIVDAIPGLVDLPMTGLAWDDWSPGGPYLWIWSTRYTSNDVRPVAYQVFPASGYYTGVSMEGVLMHPDAPYGSDYSLGATITDELIPGKVVFAGLHGSSYQQYNDQLDWVVLYDLDPEGQEIPGPEISVEPSYIQNDLLPGDSLDVPLYIENLSELYDLFWSAQLEYPGMGPNPEELGDLLLDFDATALTPDQNKSLRGLLYLDDHIWVCSGKNFNNQFKLYKISNDGSTVVQVYTLYSAFSGWSAITTDGQYIYGADQYSITQFDPNSGGVVGYIPRPGFSPDGLTYDPQKDHFYLGNSVGAIMQIDRDGNELNFFVTPYKIEGLAWDQWSPGGPYIWAWHEMVDGEDTLCVATRLDPATCTPDGISFYGTDLNGDPGEDDRPVAAAVTPDWQENRLVMVALQKSNNEPDDGHDMVAIYDLATTPPPGWIELQIPSIDTTLPQQTDTLIVRLKAIMEDTLMTAKIVIKNNDVINPVVEIPVNFRMLPNIVSTEHDLIIADQQADIHLYPNPSQDIVHLTFQNIGDELLDLTNSSSEVFVEIFNNSGQLFHSQQIPGPVYEGMNITLNLSGLTDGIYVAVIKDQETTIARKRFILLD